MHSKIMLLLAMLLFLAPTLSLAQIQVSECRLAAELVDWCAGRGAGAMVAPKTRDTGVHL